MPIARIGSGPHRPAKVYCKRWPLWEEHRAAAYCRRPADSMVRSLLICLSRVCSSFLRGTWEDCMRFANRYPNIIVLPHSVRQFSRYKLSCDVISQLPVLRIFKSCITFVKSNSNQFKRKKFAIRSQFRCLCIGYLGILGGSIGVLDGSGGDLVRS